MSKTRAAEMVAMHKYHETRAELAALTPEEYEESARHGREMAFAEFAKKRPRVDVTEAKAEPPPRPASPPVIVEEDVVFVEATAAPAEERTVLQFIAEMHAEHDAEKQSLKLPDAPNVFAGRVFDERHWFTHPTTGQRVAPGTVLALTSDQLRADGWHTGYGGISYGGAHVSLLVMKEHKRHELTEETLYPNVFDDDDHFDYCFARDPKTHHTLTSKPNMALYRACKDGKSIAVFRMCPRNVGVRGDTWFVFWGMFVAATVPANPEWWAGTSNAARPLVAKLKRLT